jgi:hypothetical protein
MKARDTVNASGFAEFLSYDPETGVLTWKPSLGYTWRERAWNTRYAGTVTGCKSSERYLEVRLFGRLWKAHRVAWAIHYGEWPNEELDHINGDRADNRIKNLRPANRKENSQNLAVRCTNTSGFTGVHRHHSWKRWQARIVYDYRRINLGMFDTPEEAYQAYLAAKAKLHRYDTSGRECLG